MRTYKFDNTELFASLDALRNKVVYRIYDGEYHAVKLLEFYIESLSSSDPQVTITINIAGIGKKTYKSSIYPTVLFSWYDRPNGNKISIRDLDEELVDLLKKKHIPLLSTSYSVCKNSFYTRGYYWEKRTCTAESYNCRSKTKLDLLNGTFTLDLPDDSLYTHDDDGNSVKQLVHFYYSKEECEKANPIKVYEFDDDEVENVEKKLKEKTEALNNLNDAIARCEMLGCKLKVEFAK